VKEVTGAFTGAYATNPLSGERIPVWIGEYVLKDYGTGAIMAVPSDDERDHNFANKYGLKITQVVDQSDYPKAGTEWVNRDGYTMETNTMPGYAGSSWYFLRYMDPNNPEEFASKEALDYWQDVDLYIGGTEHAVGHLLYSRFVHKFLFDKGLVPTKEPFRKLVNQGMIQGVIESLYLNKENGEFYTEEQVENEGDFAKINTHVDFVTDYSTGQS